MFFGLFKIIDYSGIIESLKGLSLGIRSGLSESDSNIKTVTDTEAKKRRPLVEERIRSGAIITTSSIQDTQDVDEFLEKKDESLEEEFKVVSSATEGERLEKKKESQEEKSKAALNTIAEELLPGLAESQESHKQTVSDPLLKSEHVSPSASKIPKGLAEIAKAEHLSPSASEIAKEPAEIAKVEPVNAINVNTGTAIGFAGLNSDKKSLKSNTDSTIDILTVEENKTAGLTRSSMKKEENRTGHHPNNDAKAAAKRRERDLQRAVDPSNAGARGYILSGPLVPGTNKPVRYLVFKESLSCLAKKNFAIF